MACVAVSCRGTVSELVSLMCRVVVCVVRVGGFFFFVGGFVFMRCRALVCSEVDVVTSCFAGFRVQMSGRDVWRSISF